MTRFGDFHFGPPIDAVPRDENPLLLAWPVNNYWDTNFPLVQSGRISLRYGLLSVPSAQVESVHDHALAFRQPPLDLADHERWTPRGHGKTRLSLTVARLTDAMASSRHQLP